MKVPGNEAAARPGAADPEGHREAGTLVSLAGAAARVKGEAMSTRSLLALKVAVARGHVEELVGVYLELGSCEPEGNGA
jgi:hypothetical protein